MSCFASENHAANRSREAGSCWKRSACFRWGRTNGVAEARETKQQAANAVASKNCASRAMADE
jgi:hypothetical protein